VQTAVRGRSAQRKGEERPPSAAVRCCFRRDRVYPCPCCCGRCCVSTANNQNNNGNGADRDKPCPYEQQTTTATTPPITSGASYGEKHHHKTLGAGSRRYVCIYSAVPMLWDGSDVRLRQAGHKLPMIGFASHTPSPVTAVTTTRIQRPVGHRRTLFVRSLRLWVPSSNNA
jgi:hypothetical protein